MSDPGGGGLHARYALRKIIDAAHALEAMA
jgi:hypothetical protein